MESVIDERELWRNYRGFNWRDLPSGEQGHNFNPDTLECPVCLTRVRFVDRLEWGSHDELRIFICPKCNASYSHPFPRDSQPLETYDPLEERLRLMEQRLAQQERLITHLIDEVERLKTQSLPPTRPPRVADDYDEEQEQDSRDLARKYHHLL